MTSHNLVLMATSQGVTAIPREIDDHLRMFGKEPWEVDYDLYGYATCAIPELTNLAFVHAVEQLTSMEFLPFWQPDNGFIRRKEGTKDLDRTKAKYSPCLLRVIRVPVQRLSIQ